MNTHPDVMWELVRDRQARLRQEAEQHNRSADLRQALRSRSGGPHEWAGAGDRFHGHPHVASAGRPSPAPAVGRPDRRDRLHAAAVDHPGRR